MASFLLILLIFCGVKGQISTVTKTFEIRTTTTTTSTQLVNALCASYVSVSGSCRRRKQLRPYDPQLFLAYDQGLNKRILDPSAVRTRFLKC